MEKLKDIKGYEGLYGITSCGRVWSYRRNKFIKPFKPSKSDYLCVNLYKDNTRKAFLVHRLVAEAYIPNPDNLPQVNHKDEVKTHNWINNLEWCDAKYNIRYSHGKKVKCIETGEIFNSAAEAGEAVNRNKWNISAACAGIQKTCGGYHWQYIGDDI